MRPVRSLEGGARLGHLRLAHPAGEQWLAATVSQGDHCLRRLQGPCHGLRGEDGEHAVDRVVLQTRPHREPIALGGSVADQVDRVAVRPVGGQAGIERLNRRRRELRQRHVEVGGAVGRHHPGTATIGDDGEAVADRVKATGERLGGGEKLAHGLHPHHTGPAHRSVEHVVGADQGRGVCHRRAAASVVPPDLDQQHRLDPRRRPQRAHEAACMADALDVEQDAARLRVEGEVVEDLAEVDVGR